MACGSELVDFADTAALLSALDLVIGLDTAVVHLAGALNLPVGALLPANADWRWMRARGDSPWYPSMRLFRQSVLGDSSAVIGEVVDALGQVRSRKKIHDGRHAVSSSNGDVGVRLCYIPWVCESRVA